MSSVTNFGSSGGKSSAVPQGTYQADKLSAMYNSKPAATQNPQATMKVMSAIFNSPDCCMASMTEKQAERSKNG